MARQSVFEVFLRKFPEPKRSEIEKLVLGAPTAKQAFDEVKKLYRFRGGYHTLVSWRAARKSVPTNKADREIVTTPPATYPNTSNPIDEIRALHRRTNAYCDRLLNLLENHNWIEVGEDRLSQRQAEKLLIALPALTKSSTSGLLEMSRLKLQIDEKRLSLAVLFELSEDWRRTLEGDNPELLPLLDSILTITKARLELDVPTVLDDLVDRENETESEKVV